MYVFIVLNYRVFEPCKNAFLVVQNLSVCSSCSSTKKGNSI